MLSSKHKSVSFQPGCQTATVCFPTRIAVETKWWHQKYLLLPSKRFPFVTALHIIESRVKRGFLQMFYAFHFSLSSSHWRQLSKHSCNHLSRSRSAAAFHSRILYAVCLLLWLHLDAISIPLSATSVLRGCSFHPLLLLWRCLVRHISEGLPLPSRVFHTVKSLYDLFRLKCSVSEKTLP